jgi:hypothetical protein
MVEPDSSMQKLREQSADSAISVDHELVHPEFSFHSVTTHTGKSHTSETNKSMVLWITSTITEPER